MNFTRSLKTGLPALLVFLMVQMLFAAILTRQQMDYFSVSSWNRWDSGHYLKIATEGYELFPCAGKFGFPEDSPHKCGNTGWFPGFPLLIRLTALTGLTPGQAGVLWAHFFALASLWIILILTGFRSFTLKSLLLTGIAAFGFSFVYHHAIFPISAVTFFSLASFWAYRKNYLQVCRIFCFLSAVFYPTGFLLAGTFSLFLLFSPGLPFLQRLRQAVVPSLFGILGIGVVFLYYHFAVGEWSAFLQVQSKYGHSFQSPVKNMGSFFRSMDFLEPFTANGLIQWQSIVIIAGFLLLSFFFFRNKMHREPLFLWTFLYVALFFLFPWTVSGDLSRYRSEALLIPVVLLFPRVSSVWLSVILSVMLAFGIPMTHLFFNAILE